MRLSIACVLFAYVACVFGGGVHQIPLVLRQNHTALQQLLQSQRYETVNVDGEESPIPAIPLSLVNMYVWNLGALNVGNPEKTVYVDYNIYSSDSYLVDKIANPLSNYNGSESRSFKKSSKRFQSPDLADGYWATDYFKLLDPVDRARGVQPAVRMDTHIAGGVITFTFSTLGLGPVKDSNSFLTRIKNQLKDPLYSIYFEPYVFAEYSACLFAGEQKGNPKTGVDHHPTLQRLSLTFGDIDSHCSKEPLFFTDYVNVSVIAEQFHPWAFHLDAFVVHPSSGEHGLSIQLNEDAGIWMYPVILGPAEHVHRIARHFGAVRAGPLAFFEYQIACEKRVTAPSVFFRVGQNVLELKSSDYIVEVYIEGTSITGCYLAFASNLYGITAGDKWLVGTPLFNAKCLIVDFGRNKIGFAAAKTV